MTWLFGLNIAALALPAGLLVILAPEIMGRGLAGLGLPLALVGGLLLMLCLGAHPWGARAPTPTTAVGLRFDAPRLRRLIGATSVLVCLLLLWGELAALRLVAVWWGWRPSWTLIGFGLVAIAVVAWTRERWLVRLRAGAFLVTGVGLCLPVALIVARTDPRPLAVWGEVASRATFTFQGETTWRPLPDPWLPSRPLGIEFRQAQRVTSHERGRLRLVLSVGGRSQTVERTAQPDGDVAFLKGDSLVLLDPVRLTFEAGREIPGSPPSGGVWGDGEGRRLRAEAGAVAALLLGALGLPPLLFVLGSAPSPRIASRALLLGVVFLSFLLFALQLWAIYAARFAPQLYLGGVRWGEVVSLPSLVGMGPEGRGLTLLAQVALVSAFAGTLAGTLQAASAAARGVGGARWPKLSVWVVGCIALALGSLWPLHPYRLALAAFTLAASTLTPALVLTAWWSRLTPAGLGAGISTGLILFSVTLAAAHVTTGDQPIAWDVMIRAPALWLAPLAGLVMAVLSLPRPRGLSDHFSLLHRRLSRDGV